MKRKEIGKRKRIIKFFKILSEGKWYYIILNVQNPADSSISADDFSNSQSNLKKLRQLGNTVYSKTT